MDLLRLRDVLRPHIIAFKDRGRMKCSPPSARNSVFQLLLKDLNGKR
jgi:hypothetical protein